MTSPEEFFNPPPPKILQVIPANGWRWQMRSAAGVERIYPLTCWAVVERGYRSGTEWSVEGVDMAQWNPTRPSSGALYGLVERYEGAEFQGYLPPADQHAEDPATGQILDPVMGLPIIPPRSPGAVDLAVLEVQAASLTLLKYFLGITVGLLLLLLWRVW